MTKYIITFKPIDSFFFGGQITFKGGSERNYLVKSELMPQQTTVIGMLRKQILVKHGPYNINGKYENGEEKEIQTKIGNASFSIKGNNDFGVIKNISPVFITDGTLHYIPIPLDRGYEFKKQSGTSGSNAVKKNKDFVPEISGYKAKEYLPSGFIASDGKTPKSEDDIFQPVEKIGINKGLKGEIEEEALYKQTSYKFKGKYCFAVIVESDLEFSDDIVEMGGDRSSFKMSVKAISEDFVQTFKNIYHGNNRVILLGDTFAPEDIYDKCDFAITQTVKFRHFKDFSKGINKTDNYEFLKRGSVLYGDTEEISEAITNPNLTKAGYNIFIK